MNKSNIQQFFRGRKIVIATQHNKEKVIDPILTNSFSLNCFVCSNLNTDLFGTFTGEIERRTDPVEAARQKCLKAMELSGCDLAISNEGSFGPHPTIPFIHADNEIVLLIDKKYNYEFIVNELSTQTNFNGKEIQSFSELENFAASALFPSHGLILRKSRNSNEDIYKGITTIDELKTIYETLIFKHGKIYVETDMRAVYNPLRMKVIELAMEKLVKKIKSQCPNCFAPGFSITDSREGLPCENCGFPTRSILMHLYSCLKCGYSLEKLHPHGRFFEDPMYCDMCNP